MLSVSVALKFSVASMLAIGLTGCCTMSGGPSGNSEPPRCPANGQPNAEVPISSSCKVIVQMEEVCVYDGEGRLKDITSKPRGLCFCIPF